MIQIVSSTNKKGYYKVYFEDELLGSLPEKFIPAEFFMYTKVETGHSLSLRDSVTISDLEIKEFIAFTKNWVRQNAQAKLLDYLAKAEKTVYDCRLYLKKWDVPEPVIKQTLDYAKERKWLSDLRYATLYAEEAKLCERSPIDTRHKLIQKKIKPETIEKAIASVFNKHDTKDILKKHIEKLLQRHSDLPPQKQFEKIATALYRKGFEYNDYEDILKKKIKY